MSTVTARTSPVYCRNAAMGNRTRTIWTRRRPARNIAQRIFDGLGNFLEAPPSFAGHRDALSAGAVGQQQLGATTSRRPLRLSAADELVRDADALTAGDQPFILEFSAGNAGPSAQTMDSPAVAKNVIATGASQNNRFDFFIYTDGQEAMADFSSRGPCEDGRIKPDLVGRAPGSPRCDLTATTMRGGHFTKLCTGGNCAGPHVAARRGVRPYYRQTHGGRRPRPHFVGRA
jgi:hypothetical protein